MAVIRSIAKRELRGYFATPVAYVFIVIFLVLTGAFTFYLGGFYERGQADLSPFFSFHPWLYLFLVPAIAMRLWAEERKTGSIELLMTLPVTTWQAVLGKFLAAWAVHRGIALALTFPIWITRQLSGRSGQRRDRRRLSRQPADGRRLPGHRLLHLGGQPQPGDRLHHHRGDLLPVPAGRASRWCWTSSPAGCPQWLVDAVAEPVVSSRISPRISKGVIDLRDVLISCW